MFLIKLVLNLQKIDYACPIIDSVKCSVCFEGFGFSLFCFNIFLWGLSSWQVSFY